jgi:hypothetical protein
MDLDLSESGFAGLADEQDSRLIKFSTDKAAAITCARRAPGLRHLLVSPFELTHKLYGFQVGSCG